MQEKRMEVQEGGDHVGKIKVTNFQFFVRSEAPHFNLFVLDTVTQGCNLFDPRLNSIALDIKFQRIFFRSFCPIFYMFYPKCCLLIFKNF